MILHLIESLRTTSDIHEERMVNPGLILPISYENLALRTMRSTSENGVIDSTNSNGESVSPWKIPRLILEHFQG